MKEAVAELRAALRRLRPQLLLLHQAEHGPLPLDETTTLQPTSGNGSLDGSHGDTKNADPSGTASTSAGNSEASVVHELQLEATSELVHALASFVWSLDCLWESCLSGSEGDITDGDGSVGNGRAGHVIREPHTEWNDEAKALIREGYGLLAASSRAPSHGDQNLYNPQLDNGQQRHHESVRTIVRSSLLELLPSVSTSPCRHFLLAFLPHFMPSSDGTGRGNVRGVPAWLTDGSDNDEDSSTRWDATMATQRYDSQQQTPTEGTDDVAAQALEAFQSLIQTDASTLVPFLSILTTLFETLPDEGASAPLAEAVAQDKSLENDDAHEDIVRTISDDPEPTTAGNARARCFRLCLSSLSSVTEHDVPSLLHSLFSLVRTAEEGRMAMEAVRNEWQAMFGGGAAGTADRIDDTTGDGDSSKFFVGNVVMQSILSEGMPGARHLAKGFVNALRQSFEAEECTSPVVLLLDVIVLIALYGHPDYECIIRSVLDSMSTGLTFEFVELTRALIGSWRPTSTGRWSDRERSNSLLYEPLASPLISVVFYVMISSSSLLAEQGRGRSGTALAGGLLSFRNASPSNAKDAPNDVGASSKITDACCRIFADLFSVLDPQRRDQVVTSLLSMVSDSFVRSAPSEMPRSKRGRKRQGSRMSNAHDANEQGSSQTALLGASRAACRTLLLTSNTHALDLSQIRGAVLDRLLLLASTSASDGDGGASDDEIAHHLFDMNSAIVISLLQGTHQSEAIDGSGSSELLILCQKLLFSANFMSTATSISNNSHQHRVVCGLILAARLLRCNLLPAGERGSILNWVMTIVSPSPTADTPLEALDPEVARWGLAFLRFASSVLHADSSQEVYPEISHFVDTQSVCGQKECFDQVNKMLATAAIIQMEDSLRVPALQSTPDNESSPYTPQTFLAFTEVDRMSKKKVPAATSYVISTPYYLHGKNGRECKASVLDGKKPLLSPIHQVAEYVHDLVDQYLELGTAKSGSWNPRGWLLARIQLPCCLSGPSMEALGMKEHYCLELDADLKDPASDVLSLLKINLDARGDFAKRWEVLFADDAMSKTEVVQNLVEFTKCIIISISVSSAVLKHAYQHFQREDIQLSTTSNDGASLPVPSPTKASGDAAKIHRRKKRQLEALRKLLQFQVTKIHTMQRICNNICTALKRLYIEVCKLNAARPKRRVAGKHPSKEENGDSGEVVSSGHNESEKSYERQQIHLSELKATVAAMEIFLSSRINTIDSSILWSCIDDDLDDATLIQSFNPTEGSDKATSSISDALRIIRLRRTVLQCLQQNLHGSGGLSWQSEGKVQRDISLRGISRVLRMTVSLTACLGRIGKDDETTVDADFIRSVVKSFLSAHYKVLLTAFSSATKGVPLRPSLRDNILPSAKRNQTKQPVNDCSNSLLDDIIQECAKSLPSPNSESHSTPIEALSKSLLQQLECSEDASISCQLVDLLSILFMHTDSSGAPAEHTLCALYSVYTSCVGRATLPYTAFKIHDILVDAIEDEEQTRDRTSTVSLIKTSNALLKARDPFTVAAVHNLLAHWSSLVLEGASQMRCVTEVIEALEAFLSGAFRRTKKNGVPPLRKNNKLPGLDEKSYTSLFELLMHMINASFALSRPHRIKKKRSSQASRRDGPYEEVIWPLEAYGKLLSIFQSNHIFFPRRFVLVVVKSSLTMLRLSDYQLEQCVEWRNSQQPQIGVERDSAAVELLQPLVDNVASNCIGAIISFCNTIKVRQKGSERSWGSSYKHSKAIAGLQLRCEGTKETLQSICQSQNLRFPKDFTSQQYSDGSQKRKRGDDGEAERKRQRNKKVLSPPRKIRSLHSSEKTLQSSSVLEQLESQSGQSKLDLRFAYTNGNSSPQSDSEESNMSTADDSMPSSNDDDSFGVVGDWAA